MNENSFCACFCFVYILWVCVCVFSVSVSEVKKKRWVKGFGESTRTQFTLLSLIIEKNAITKTKWTKPGKKKKESKKDNRNISVPPLSHTHWNPLSLIQDHHGFNQAFMDCCFCFIFHSVVSDQRNKERKS